MSIASFCNPEFKLAELEPLNLKQYQVRLILDARKKAIPKPRKLEKLRDHAECEDVLDIDENELAMAFESHSGLFKLEHGPTTVTLGRVWNELGGAYRLLWLLDGRTIEIIHPHFNEKALLYADGTEIGSYEVVDRRRFWFFFKAACVWVIRFGDDEIIRLDQQRRFQTRIRIQLSGRQPVETWIGFAKGAPMDDYIFRLLHKVRLRKSVPENTRWFLPRYESGLPIASTFEERIAMTVFAMLRRRPQDGDNTTGSSGIF